MTDSAYRAKNWLMRFDALIDERQKKINKVALLNAKVNNCVSGYDFTGRKDPITARAAHEDLLIEYSSACQELETINNKIIYEDNITIKILSKINNTRFRVVLFARYVNRKPWQQLNKERLCGLKRTQLQTIHLQALEALGAILDNESELTIIENKIT